MTRSGNSGGGGDKSRYTISKVTDSTTGEVTYKLMESLNDEESTEVGDVIGLNGNEILVQQGDSIVLLNGAISNIQNQLDKTYDFKTFTELGITTVNKTLLEITQEIIAKHLPTNTVVTGQLYTKALPFTGNAEAEVLINSPALWWKCGSLNVAPYSWNAITGPNGWGPEQDGMVMDWTPSNYTLPAASTETLGGVKIGNGIDVNNGVISVGSVPSSATGTTQNTADDSTKIATTEFVHNVVDALPEPMVFTGSITLIADETDTSKAAITVSNPASAANIVKGCTYKITSISGTYTGSLKVGDTFIAAKNAPDVTATWVEDTDWTVVPSGDDVILPATANPIMDGTAAVGSSFKYAKEDHVHPTDTSRAANVMSDYAVDTTRENITTSSTVQGAIEQLEYREELNKTNILSIQDVIGSILVYGTQSWDTVQAIVRSGLAPQYYPVGTLLYDNMDESTGKAFRVVGYDNFFDETLTDQGYSHSMTLLEEKLNYPSIQFDAPEAWLYLSYDGQDIVSGTAYRFTIPNYDASYGGNKTYIFTATANVSKETAADAGDGGQLTLAWAYQQNPSSVNAFENSSSTTPLFGNNGASISEWNGTDECINLGTIKLAMSDADSTYGKLNHIHRVRYGSNNYYQSGMRQWLNATTASDWWQPTTIFDRVYGSRSTAGRLSTLNANMVAKIATPTITCITNNLFETGFALNTQYTVKDKIFLLTHTEVGLSDNPNIGNTLAYYVGAANSKRIKYKTDNTAQHWWLRTPYPSYATLERNVTTSGALSINYANNNSGAAAACIIQ